MFLKAMTMAFLPFNQANLYYTLKKFNNNVTTIYTEQNDGTLKFYKRINHIGLDIWEETNEICDFSIWIKNTELKPLK